MPNLLAGAVPAEVIGVFGWRDITALSLIGVAIVVVWFAFRDLDRVSGTNGPKQP